MFLVTLIGYFICYATPFHFWPFFHLLSSNLTQSQHFPLFFNAINLLTWPILVHFWSYIFLMLITLTDLYLSGQYKRGVDINKRICIYFICLTSCCLLSHQINIVSPLFSHSLITWPLYTKNKHMIISKALFYCWDLVYSALPNDQCSSLFPIFCKNETNLRRKWSTKCVIHFVAGCERFFLQKNV